MEEQLNPPHPKSSRGAWTAAAVVMAACAFATFTLHRVDDGAVARVSQENGASEGAAIGAGPGGETVLVPGENGLGPTNATSQTGQGQAAGGDTKVSSGGKVYDCAKGENAGGSDTGVSSKQVRFAATVVKTGIAKDFLSDAQFAMEAVRLKVNKAGGICGRTIEIDYVDDGWSSDMGGRTISSFIGSNKYFGLAVNPSSEGLKGAIDSGTIRNSKFPVIGSDGQLLDQYTDPWVWPVATSTASVMHVMAANAHSRGAATFGIVYDSHYRFGVEGEAAFQGTVKRLGGTVTVSKPLDTSSKSDFANEASDFMRACGVSFANCDFVAMLLEPATADVWVTKNGGLGDGQRRPKVGIGVPQPLFIDSFAKNCGSYCANMWAWTSFKPPIPPFDTEPAVRQYKADVAAVNGNADVNNPHVQGAYVGMLLLVDVLKKMGPTPTRTAARDLLNNTVLDTQLAPTIKFTADNHYGNIGAQAFEAIVQGNSFANWRYTNSGFINDTEVGKDVVK